LQEAAVLPYDLVIFDEAHKLAASRGADLRVHRTDRYRLAEALACVTSEDESCPYKAGCEPITRRPLPPDPPGDPLCVLDFLSA
jgi:hypothetical protein